MLAQKVWHIPWKSTLFKINESFFHPGDVEAGGFFSSCIGLIFLLSMQIWSVILKIKTSSFKSAKYSENSGKLESFNVREFFSFILYCNWLARGVPWSSSNMNSLILSGFLGQLQKIRPSAYIITRLAIRRTCYRNAFYASLFQHFVEYFSIFFRKNHRVT